MSEVPGQSGFALPSPEAIAAKPYSIGEARNDFELRNVIDRLELGSPVAFKLGASRAVIPIGHHLRSRKSLRAQSELGRTARVSMP
jgi:hypothetical protein